MNSTAVENLNINPVGAQVLIGMESGTAANKHADL